MLSPVFMRDERNLGRLTHEKLQVFREGKKIKSKKYQFYYEKVKVMLLALKVMLLDAEVMLLHAEVMPLQMGT